MTSESLTSKPSEPSLDDVEITPSTHWWGFVLHFNEDATKLLEQIDSFAAKLTAALPEEVKPISSLIKYYIKLRNVVIKLEDRGQGVKLVSPWIMPTLLVPLPDSQHVDDSQLRWSTFSNDPRDESPDDSGDDGPWSDEQKLQQVFSESSPSLAVYQDKLVCAARGGGSDQNLYWMTFDGEWSDYTMIGHALSTDGPALAEFQGKLHLLHRGSGNNEYIWWMTYDGNSWTGDRQIGHVLSASSPALAEFQGKLHLVHRGSGSNESIWWATYDGNSWSGDQQIGHVLSAAGPALAVFQGKLHLVHRGSGSDEHLWWATYDGNSWSGDQMISKYVYSADGPALAVFEDKLYLVARGGGDQDLWWMTYDGNSWSQYQKINNVYSARTPGLASYRHPKGTRNQLLCMHRGSK